MRAWRWIAHSIPWHAVLVGLTIISAASFLAYVLRVRKKSGSANMATTFIIVIAVSAVGIALCCSYGLLFAPASGTSAPFGFLLNPFVRFLLNVLAILLIILFIAIVTLGLLDPWRIEVTAKLFGAEFSFKKKYEESQASLDQVRIQAEQTEALLTQVFQDWQDWSGLIAALNRNILSCLRSPAAAVPAGCLTDPLASMQETIRDVLVRSYAVIPDSVEIMVLPLTDEAVASLPPVLASRIAEVRLADDTAAVVDGNGIALGRGPDGRGILVILSGLQGYEVSPAEAAAAGILLTALLKPENDGRQLRS